MIQSTEIRTGRHCIFKLHVHLVFVTKYRKKIFQSIHLIEMKTIFAKVCSDMEVNMQEMNGEEDHVHILLNYPPKLAISVLVNSLKGVSSRLLRKKFPELETRYYKNVLWSPSYFAASCGGASIDIISQYIKQQQTPN